MPIYNEALVVFNANQRVPDPSKTMTVAEHKEQIAALKISHLEHQNALILELDEAINRFALSTDKAFSKNGLCALIAARRTLDNKIGATTLGDYYDKSFTDKPPIIEEDDIVIIPNQQETITKLVKQAIVVSLEADQIKLEEAKFIDAKPKDTFEKLTTLLADTELEKAQKSINAEKTKGKLPDEVQAEFTSTLTSLLAESRKKLLSEIRETEKISGLSTAEKEFCSAARKLLEKEGLDTQIIDLPSLATYEVERTLVKAPPKSEGRESPKSMLHFSWGQKSESNPKIQALIAQVDGHLKKSIAYPRVATQPGYSDYLTHKAGILLNKINAHEIAKKSGIFSADPGKLAALEKGAALLKEFSPDNIAAYETALQSFTKHDNKTTDRLIGEITLLKDEVKKFQTVSNSTAPKVNVL